MPPRASASFIADQLSSGPSTGEVTSGGRTYTDEAVGREGGAMTTRSLLGYHLQSTAPLEVGGPDQGGPEWCPTVWKNTMDSLKMAATCTWS